MQYRLHKAIRLFARLVCGGLMGGHINGYMFLAWLLIPWQLPCNTSLGRTNNEMVRLEDDRVFV
jgi:hypothetical protein